MNLLAIETSGLVCSVCVAVANDVHIVETMEPFQHDAMLATFTHTCLADAGIEVSDLDAIAVSAGPGSFTGLRIGASFAKGLGFGLPSETEIPIIQVSTLHTLVTAFLTTHTSNGNVVAVIPSHRELSYCEVFNSTGTVVSECRLYNPMEIQEILNASGCLVTPDVDQLEAKFLASGIRLQGTRYSHLLSSKWVLKTAQQAIESGTARLISPTDFVPNYNQDFVVR
jgi:tRNA threonylcarbamoyl adenosine modification protein YeaZ